MNKREEAYKPFANLKKRLEEIAEALGLEVESMILFVNDEYLVNVVWSVKDEAVMTDAEKDQRRVDAEFAKMMGNIADPFEAQAKSAKEDLARWLEGNE